MDIGFQFSTMPAFCYWSCSSWLRSHAIGENQSHSNWFEGLRLKVFNIKNLNYLFHLLVFYFFALIIFTHLELTIAWAIALAITHDLNLVLTKNFAAVKIGCPDHYAIISFVFRTCCTCPPGLPSFELIVKNGWFFFFFFF